MKDKNTLQQDIKNNPNSSRLQNLLAKMDSRILDLMKEPSSENLKRALLTIARKKEIQKAIELSNVASG